MALPEFEAISFRRILEKGAHTKPWLIEVGTNNGPTPYIAKIYTPDQIATSNSVTAEVLGNILAKEFDLHAPNAALIHFSAEFRMFLNAECQIVLDQADERPKFGSEYLFPSSEFTIELSKKTFKRFIDPDTLYAFDNFIRNGDRGERKTNLILHKKMAWVIDHEMAFDIDENTIDEFNRHTMQEKFCRHHLSYLYLKKSSKATKKAYFETFGYYLQILNINIILPYLDQLEIHGYITKRKQILQYLEHIKQNSTKFVSLLQQQIR